MRFDTIRPGRLDEAIKVGTGVGAGNCVAEQEIFSANDKRPDRVLDQIIVHAQPPVFEIHDELRPLIVRIVHRPAERRAWRHDRDVLVQPGPEFLEQRPGSQDPDALPLFWRQ